MQIAVAPHAKAIDAKTDPVLAMGLSPLRDEVRGSRQRHGDVFDETDPIRRLASGIVSRMAQNSSCLGAPMGR